MIKIPIKSKEGALLGYADFLEPPQPGFILTPEWYESDTWLGDFDLGYLVLQNDPN